MNDSTNDTHQNSPNRRKDGLRALIGGAFEWLQGTVLGGWRTGRRLFAPPDRFHGNDGDSDIDVLTFLQRKLEQMPPDPAAYAMLAHTYELQGDLERALAVAERAVKLGPAHREAWYRLGSIYQKQGSVEPALAAYLRAAGDGQDFVAWTALQQAGELLLEHERPTEAVGYVERAVEVSLQNPEPLRTSARIYALLGRAQAAAGDVERAKEAFRVALALDPDNGRAQAELSQL